MDPFAKPGEVAVMQGGFLLALMVTASHDQESADWKELLFCFVFCQSATVDPLDPVARRGSPEKPPEILLGID